MKTKKWLIGQVWTSRSGVFNLQLESEDSVRIDNNTTFTSQTALLYSHNGTIAYDNIFIPEYIKKQVEKMLNPCIGIVAIQGQHRLCRDCYTLYKEFKYHRESMNNYNGYIKMKNEIPDTWYSYKVSIENTEATEA